MAPCRPRPLGRRRASRSRSSCCPFYPLYNPTLPLASFFGFTQAKAAEKEADLAKGAAISCSFLMSGPLSSLGRRLQAKAAEKKEEAPKEEEKKEEAKPAVAISASTVKELREKTGAGMMDCKKALNGEDGRDGGRVSWRG